MTMEIKVIDNETKDEYICRSVEEAANVFVELQKKLNISTISMMTRITIVAPLSYISMFTAALKLKKKGVF